MHRILQLTKTVLALLWVRSGLLALMHRLQGPRILVLAYHRVTPDDELARCAYPAMHVSCSSFEKQLQAVQKLYRVIPLSELQSILDGASALREPVAVVTFDDGYEDNFTNAFPILTRCNVPATFFLSFAFVDRREPFWFDRLAEAVHAWDHQPDARPALRQQLPQDVLQALESPSPLPERCRRAAAALKKLSDTDRQAVVATLQEQLDLQAHGTTTSSLTWEQARQMCQAGMQVGAHSVSHAILTSQSQERARDEVTSSLQGVSRRLGMPVEAFAYPNGDTNDSVTSIVQQAGGTVAFTMQPRHNRPGDARLRLGRRNVCEDTSRSAFRSFSRDWFWCEISGFFDVVLRRQSRGGAHA
jgi:peptidoglycan/xylan/chitin deacetylase (PgdA/CDA1 family)